MRGISYLAESRLAYQGEGQIFEIYDMCYLGVPFRPPGVTNTAHVQIMQLLVVQFSSGSCCFFPL
jgi:hypothetical protein